MRFDDSLKTVLAADASTAFGAQAAFRQLADLMARGRVPAKGEPLARLRTLRDKVPVETRAATARALVLAEPPAAMVRLFAEDERPIASATLRAARIQEADWLDLLPRIGPAGRAVLRTRRDLPAGVTRALASFGATDFALDAPATFTAPVVEEPEPVRLVEATTPAPAPSVARDELPTTPSGYEIVELMDRIAAFQRGDHPPVGERLTGAEAANQFRFETDATGTIRWTDAEPRGAVIGLSLNPPDRGTAAVDGLASGAFRRRTGFDRARLQVPGGSAVGGEWRISGVPLFDRATGRFDGYRGAARRPRADESAAPLLSAGSGEGLRRLVHELRTPTNAITGFSELIESGLLGPVAPVYRDRAATIRATAADVVAAIDDLDTAARIDGGALELRHGDVRIAPLLTRTVEALAPLAAVRGCRILLEAVDEPLLVVSDDRALDRLVSRLIATLVSGARDGETIAITTAARDGAVEISVGRPAAFGGIDTNALLSLDAESEAVLPGSPLLGTGFALRLVRSLARELNGSLSIEAERLTLRLPAGSIGDMGQASTN